MSHKASIVLRQAQLGPGNFVVDLALRLFLLCSFLVRGFAARAQLRLDNFINTGRGLAAPQRFVPLCWVLLVGFCGLVVQWREQQNEKLK
jgi:hypothetical protein